MRTITVKTDPTDARFIIVTNTSECAGVSTESILAKMCKCTAIINGCDPADDTTCKTSHNAITISDANGTTTIYSGFAELTPKTLKKIGSTDIGDMTTIAQVCTALKVLVGAIVP